MGRLKTKNLGNLFTNRQLPIYQIKENNHIYCFFGIIPMNGKYYSDNVDIVPIIGYTVP